MFDQGEFISQDYEEAVNWWRKAAEQGDATAQSNLGAMYANGHGVQQDYTEAAKWYLLAANQGLAGAQAQFACVYQLGDGLPKDYVLAYMWFNLAAAEGDKAAAEGREAIAKEMSQEQIAEAQRLSREWYSAHKANESVDER